MAIPELFTLSEAGERLRCSYSTVQRMARNGKIASIKRGHDVLISAEAIAAYLESHTRPVKTSQRVANAVGRTIKPVDLKCVKLRKPLAS
jgi:excisionase family DNA binding protein